MKRRERRFPEGATRPEAAPYQTCSWRPPVGPNTLSVSNRPNPRPPFSFCVHYLRIYINPVVGGTGSGVV